MIGDIILTLYMAVNCLHMPVTSQVMCICHGGYAGDTGGMYVLYTQPVAQIRCPHC
jgi:hypothetical protein